MRRSAVNDGSCSPWVMCSCSVVRGNQIRDKYGDYLFSTHHSRLKNSNSTMKILSRGHP